MIKRLKRCLCLCALVVMSAGLGRAEKVSDLPAPTGYISDFADVISPDVKAKLEQRCTEVDRQAHAQIAVVTVKTIDGDESIEEFTTELEEKWKVGPKGTDRGVLMVLVMTPRRGRIEVGYGLEGILNDAKVGDVGRSMVPDATKGDYDDAVTLGVGQISRVIAADAGVTLTPIVHRQGVTQQQQVASLNLGQMLVYGVVALVILFIVIRGGGSGLLWFLLGNVMGGGFGGGGGRRGGGFGDGGGGDDGGGFGGFGGGSSGGGGASGDF